MLLLCFACRHDIPPAAIDHHVSDILAYLLGKPAVQAPLQQLAQAGGDGPRCLQDLLWIFSSSINYRQWLQQLQQQQEQQKMGLGGRQEQQQQELEQLGPKAHAAEPIVSSEVVPVTGTCDNKISRVEWKMLQQELETQRAQEQQLLNLWQVVAPFAARYAEESISRRFGHLG